eukprot:scaffold190794_cov35-Attheya_sp.AAC.2
MRVSNASFVASLEFVPVPGPWSSLFRASHLAFWYLRWHPIPCDTVSTKKGICFYPISSCSMRRSEYGEKSMIGCSSSRMSLGHVLFGLAVKKNELNTEYMLIVVVAFECASVSVAEKVLGTSEAPGQNHLPSSPANECHLLTLTYVSEQDLRLARQLGVTPGGTPSTNAHPLTMRTDETATKLRTQRTTTQPPQSRHDPPEHPGGQTPPALNNSPDIPREPETPGITVPLPSEGAG